MARTEIRPRDSHSARRTHNARTRFVMAIFGGKQLRAPTAYHESLRRRLQGCHNRGSNGHPCFRDSSTRHPSLTVQFFFRIIRTANARFIIYLTCTLHVAIRIDRRRSLRMLSSGLTVPIARTGRKKISAAFLRFYGNCRSWKYGGYFGRVPRAILHTSNRSSDEFRCDAKCCFTCTRRRNYHVAAHTTHYHPALFIDGNSTPALHYDEIQVYAYDRTR